MGAAKTIVKKFSDAEYLLYYIQRNDYQNISNILEKKPFLLNEAITQNTKMTPLFRACYNGNLQMVSFFVQKYKANVNQITINGQTPLIAAIKRNHIKIVKYLIQHYADVNFITQLGIRTIQFAILPGFYDIALLIYERIKDKQLRSPEEYEQMNKQYRYRYVNFFYFLENLTAKISQQNVPDFLTKSKKVYIDPVVDPREGWKKWMKRQLQFKDPPIVQRQDLPEQLRPENRRLGRLSTFFSSSMMSPLNPKPTYFPKKVSKSSKSQVLFNQKQLQSKGPETNDKIQTMTIS